MTCYVPPGSKLTPGRVSTVNESIRSYQIQSLKCNASLSISADMGSQTENYTVLFRVVKNF